MAAPPTWTFAVAPTTARHPHVLLIAFSTGPLRDAAARPGASDDGGAAAAPSAPAVEERTIEARQDPAWFAGWRAGSLRAIAERDLAGALAALDAADHLHLVSVSADAPTDLGYLQAAWARARALVERGATTVLDVHAMIYRHAADVPAADAAFEVLREARIVFEASADRPDGTHALHTRGLRKLGVPDLVALCTRADAPLITTVMSELMAALARGADLPPAAQPFEATPDLRLHAVDDEHGLGQLLQLGNTARVLVDDTGGHLAGVAARLHAAQNAS